MRKLIFAVITLVVFLFPVSNVFADQKEEPAANPSVKEESTAQEVADLKTEVESLKDMVKLLLADHTGKPAIGVMPVENSYRIPQVGNAFRDMIVSALSEAGLPVSEVMDDKTQEAVRRQIELVREGIIDPVGAPRLGEMQSVSHFLFADVTKYEEADSELIFGGIVSFTGGGTRVRKGSMVVDFKLVDARNGEVVSSFRTEASLKLKELGGAVIDKAGFGGFSHKQPMPEVASRLCAQQAADKLAELFNPKPLSEEKK